MSNTAWKNIFFDLDGTLTDSHVGILRSWSYALQTGANKSFPESLLRKYLGPPLRETFRELLETQDSLLIEKCVDLYRARYTATGMFENEVYDGVIAMLDEVKALEVRTFVVTGKYELNARQIVEHFNLKKYFIETYGPQADGQYEDKAELAQMLITKYGLKVEETVIVGDRENDIRAARLNHFESIGVTYGYGSRHELEEAGATYIVESPAEVAALIKQRLA